MYRRSGMAPTVLLDLRDTTILVSDWCRWLCFDTKRLTRSQIYFFLTVSILRVATALPAYPNDNPVGQHSTYNANGNQIASSNGGSEWYSPDLNSGAVASTFAVAGSEAYKCYGGVVNAYPRMNEWLSFNALYKLNEPTLQLSNTAEQNRYIYDAIVQVSQESKVDARIILALIMQEVNIYTPFFSL